MTKKENHENETIEFETKEVIEQKDNELTNRINKLYGDTTDEIREQKEYDPKEVAVVRKKLLFLLCGVVITGFVIIIMLLQPFNFKQLFKNSALNSDNNEQHEPEVKYPIVLNLVDDLSISLNKRIEFSLTELKKYDIYPIYTKEKILVNDLPNGLKLLLLSKTEEFNQMLKTNGIDEYLSTCNKDGLTIDKTKISDVSNVVFANNDHLDFNTIDYEYIMIDGSAKKITLSISGDNYIVKCNDYGVNNSTNKYIQQKLIKVVENKDSIELYQKVVFITLEGQKGIYQDPLFTVLLTNNEDAEIDSYITNGSTYKYTFIKDNNNYRLEMIELVKEV